MNKELLSVLKYRFEKNIQRHIGILWNEVENRLNNNPDKLLSISKMEETGGEHDVVGYNKAENKYIFMDCSLESPVGRRSLCYDKEALDRRKENKPKNNAIDIAKEMGIQLLIEDDYHFLQSLGSFDMKTSSWLATPENVRRLGGAIFGDYRFGRVFIYHNGAESYYASRGFRGKLKV